MKDRSSTYGYARVSSADQSLARQIDALRAFPIKEGHIFADKASGKDFNRPAYKRLLRRLKPGDVLVVKSIDRLGRNYCDIIDEWRRITTIKHAAVVVLDMPILDTREKADGITGVFLADLMLQLMSYIAQIERENIRQRQQEGIMAAQTRGVRFGRPRIRYPQELAETLRDYQEGRVTRKEAAGMLGISVATFDRWKAHLKQDPLEKTRQPACSAPEASCAG